MTLDLRDAFEEAVKDVYSGYGYDPSLLDRTPDGSYANTDMRWKYKMYIRAYYDGCADAKASMNEPDVRFGINDSIRPELMNKRIQDWG